jgi:hypothetical protein
VPPIANCTRVSSASASNVRDASLDDRMRSSVPWSAGESGTALGVSEIERQRHEPPTSETRPGPDLFGNAKFELIFNLGAG